MEPETLVAVLGGGQLGRMLGLAGIPMGLSFRFLDPVAGAPAGAVGELVTGELGDDAAVAATAEGAYVLTYEWEGVPAAAARSVPPSVPVLPPPIALEVAQDRLAEKDLFRRLGIPTPAYAPVDDLDGLRAAVADVGLPAVLKTRRGGYDGKGQVVLREPGDADAAWSSIGGVPLVLERWVPFDRELSIIACRGRDGATAAWPVVENLHREGILRLSRAPAPGLDAAQQGAAERVASALLDALDYVGVLCVELFEVGGELLANELAPRVHNSGHWTIEGADTSQFENHLRAILGWPLGSTAARGVSAMVNLIGATPGRDAVLAVQGAHWHDYAKSPRSGRKVGHLTLNAPNEAILERRLAAILDAVGVEPPEVHR